MGGNVADEWHHSFALPPASLLECALVNICLACFEAQGDAEHHNSAGMAEMHTFCTLLLVSAIKLACTSSISLSNQASICMTADTHVSRKLSWNHVAGVPYLCLKLHYCHVVVIFMFIVSCH